MSSIDGIARTSRDNLQSSLMVTHNLTINPQSATDYIIHRMNGVLRAVANSNFDPASLQEVGQLFAAIGEVQPQMMDTAQNLALVNLSRSFAVVLEEAIRQREGNNNNNNNNNNNINNINSGAASGWNYKFNNNNNNSAVQGHDFWQTPVAASVSEWRVGGGEAVVDGGLKGFGQSKFTNGFGGLPSTAAPAAPFVDAAAAAAARAARAAKEAKKDYSPEAVEGRITVFNIPLTVTEPQLTAHFKQIGEIKEMSYPWEKIGQRKGFALLKFESNEKADAACEQLNGRDLGGSPLTVERAKHWFKKEVAPSEVRDAPAFGTLAAEKTESGGRRREAASSTSSSLSNFAGTGSTFSVKAPDSDDDVLSEYPNEKGENDPGLE